MPPFATKKPAALKFQNKRKTLRVAANAEETKAVEEPAVVKDEPVEQEDAEGPKKKKKKKKFAKVVDKAQIYAVRKLKRQQARKKLIEQSSCIPKETIVLSGDDLAAQKQRMADFNARCLLIKATESRINASLSDFKDALSVRRKRMNVANLLVEYKSRKVARKKALSLKNHYVILNHFKKKSFNEEEELVVNPCKLNLENLSKGATNDQLKKAFPKAKNIYYKDGESHGILEYENREDSEEAFRTSVRISNKNVVLWYKTTSGENKMKRKTRKRKAKFRVPPTDKKESKEEKNKKNKGKGKKQQAENANSGEGSKDKTEIVNTQKSPEVQVDNANSGEGSKDKTEIVNTQKSPEVQVDNANSEEGANKVNTRRRKQKQTENASAEESPGKKRKTN